MMNRFLYAMALGLLLVVATDVRADEQQAADKPMMEQMQKMQSHMQAMRAQMKEIKATKDPEKRKELMRQHRQSMHEGMMMMGKMDHSQGKGMSHGAMQEKEMSMDCKANDAQCQRMQMMQNRQDAMQQRMQMMQQMMEQMMEHQSESSEQ